MSVIERLQAIEQIWDTLCRDPEIVASPKWHGEVLSDRKARAESGEAKFLTLAELKARLQRPNS
jgi:hypothetical protein